MHLLFGSYRLESSQRRLLRDETLVKLDRHAMSLLLALAQRPGEVLSHRELEGTLWPHALVDDSCLRGQVAALRKALGDGSYIANVPRRGYTFVACVERRAAQDAPAAAPRPCATPRPG